MCGVREIISFAYGITLSFNHVIRQPETKHLFSSTASMNDVPRHGAGKIEAIDPG